MHYSCKVSGGSQVGPSLSVHIHYKVLEQDVRAGAAR